MNLKRPAIHCMFLAMAFTHSLLSSPALQAPISNAFCSGGSTAQTTTPTWGSHCAKGDADLGHYTTKTFKLNGPFGILLSGYPGTAGLSLTLDNLTDHASLNITPDISPGDKWKEYVFDLPSAWRGKALRIVADDQNGGICGWLGFSLPFAPHSHAEFVAARRLLLKTPLLALLTFLPGVCLCAIAIKRGVKGTLKLGMFLMAGIAMPGYVLFFVYFFSPKIGYAISAALPYLLAALLILLSFRLTKDERRLLLPFLAPLAMTLFAALGVLSLGYLYGEMDEPDFTPQHRFSEMLPMDNQIPYIFAEDLRNGSVPRPMRSDWLSSDRPPLQAGLFLALHPWTQDNKLWYQDACVLFQSLWVFSIWLLLRSLGISNITTTAVIATIYFSGFNIVNSFFVWPKLLAAAYTLAFAIPIFAARTRNPRTSWTLRVLMAFLLMCGLLAHGSVLFAVAGFVIYATVKFYRRGKGRNRGWIRETCLLGVITLAFYSPWIAYQKLVDPPGDRLLKWHFAGVIPVTPEPFLPTLIRAYREQTLAQWLDAKRQNADAVFGHEIEYAKNLLDFRNPPTQRVLRSLQFFFLMPAIGFISLGMICLLARWARKHRRREWRGADRFLLFAFATTIPWILLMFLPGGTIVHQGSYGLVLLAMAGSILAFRAALPRLALAVCALQCAFQWTLYAADVTSGPMLHSLSRFTNPWMMGLHMLSVSGFAVALWFSPTRPKVELQWFVPRSAETTADAPGIRTLTPTGT